MKRITVRVTAIAMAVLIATQPVQAGFMEDFYTSAGAAVNVSPADVRRTGSGNFVTGGSVVWKVPQRGFTPFLWQPPGLKAGCGGINMYMGSFGFANTEDFVNYLRNVGQNSLGIFFKMALKSMSPDLEGAINDISAIISKANEMATNSCEAAQALTSQFEPHVSAMSKGVRTSMGLDVADGTVPGVTEAIHKFAVNMGAVKTRIDAQATNSGGKKERPFNRNFVWSAMNAGNMADFPTSIKEIAMSISGVTIIQVNPADPNNSTISNTTPPTLKFQDLVGRWDDTTLTLKILRCNEPEECLLPTATSEAQPGFARQAYQRLIALRTKIINRQPLDATDNESLQMLGMTTLPVWKVLELTSHPSRLWLSNEYIKTFSNVIGYELAIQFVTSLSMDIETALHKKINDGDNAEVVTNLMRTKADLEALRGQAEAVKKKLDDSNGGVQGAIQAIQHLERTLYQNLSTRTMDNLKYAQR